MNVSIDEGAFIPVKAHAEDGGFDLKSPIDTFTICVYTTYIRLRILS